MYWWWWWWWSCLLIMITIGDHKVWSQWIDEKSFGHHDHFDYQLQYRSSWSFQFRSPTVARRYRSFVAFMIIIRFDRHHHVHDHDHQQRWSSSWSWKIKWGWRLQSKTLTICDLIKKFPGGWWIVLRHVVFWCTP